MYIISHIYYVFIKEMYFTYILWAFFLDSEYLIKTLLLFVLKYL